MSAENDWADNASGAKALLICSDAGKGEKFYEWGGDESAGDGSRMSATLNTAMTEHIIAQKF